MILYRASLFLFADSEIEEKEVAGRTAKQVVWLGGRREALESEHHFWASSREEAKAWLVKRLTDRVEVARGSLAAYEKQLEQAKHL